MLHHGNKSTQCLMWWHLNDCTLSETGLVIQALTHPLFKIAFLSFFLVWVWTTNYLAKSGNGSSIYQLTPGGSEQKCQLGGSGPSVSWQTSIMVEAFYACFRLVIYLFRPTNCQFVFRWIIFTKNIFIAKITKIRKISLKNDANLMVRKAFLDTILSPKCQLTVSRG